MDPTSLVEGGTDHLARHQAANFSRKIMSEFDELDAEFLIGS